MLKIKVFSWIISIRIVKDDFLTVDGINKLFCKSIMFHDRKDCCSTFCICNLFNNIILLLFKNRTTKGLWWQIYQIGFRFSVPDISLSLSGLIVGAKTLFYFKYKKTIVVDMNERKEKYYIVTIFYCSTCFYM